MVSYTEITFEDRNGFWLVQVKKSLDPVDCCHPHPFSPSLSSLPPFASLSFSHHLLSFLSSFPHLSSVPTLLSPQGCDVHRPFVRTIGTGCYSGGEVHTRRHYIHTTQTHELRYNTYTYMYRRTLTHTHTHTHTHTLAHTDIHTLAHTHVDTHRCRLT
jgi:hypothetical protein